ncbi:MAG: hypothetical protein M3Z02_00550 [Actinomycetota bacterium]|nr:hypothetical protein [Actinomycetota bacterium]
MSWLRTGLGAVMLGLPALLPRVLGLDRATATRTTWLVRMVGAREVAIGAGGLDAGRRGADLRPWLLAAAAADAGDALALVAALRQGRVARLTGLAVVASAAAGAVTEVIAARQLPVGG